MTATMIDTAPLAAAPADPSTRRRWAGRILTGLAVAFLVFDATIKLVASPEAVAGTVQLGWQAQLSDVVQQGTELDLDQLRAAQPEASPEGGRGGRDLERMPVGVAVRLRERLHERADLGLRVAGPELAASVM